MSLHPNILYAAEGTPAFEGDEPLKDSISDAVEDALDYAVDLKFRNDQRYFSDIPKSEKEACLPEFVKIYKFKRMKIDIKSRAESVLDDLIKWLDDEFMPDDATEITQEMKIAAYSFIDAVDREYIVHNFDKLENPITIKKEDYDKIREYEAMLK